MITSGTGGYGIGCGKSFGGKGTLAGRSAESFAFQHQRTLSLYIGVWRVLVLFPLSPGSEWRSTLVSFSQPPNLLQQYRREKKGLSLTVLWISAGGWLYYEEKYWPESSTNWKWSQSIYAPWMPWYRNSWEHNTTLGFSYIVQVFIVDGDGYTELDFVKHSAPKHTLSEVKPVITPEKSVCVRESPVFRQHAS